MPRSGGGVALNVTPQAREVIRRLSFQLTGHAGRRVTMDEAIRAACQVAMANPAAVLAALETEQEATA
jgi:hypothetical protein